MENESPSCCRHAASHLLLSFSVNYPELSLAHENSEILCYERDLALVDMVTADIWSLYYRNAAVTGRESGQLLIGSYIILR